MPFSDTIFSELLFWAFWAIGEMILAITFTMEYTS
jgi:hypothetical protein